MTIGPMFADSLARQLYAEIASIEQQHVTQYESLTDPDETLLEKWLLQEVAEIYNYYGCVRYETNPRIKSIWERFVDYEIGHFHFVRELFEKTEKRDAAEVVPLSLPEPIDYRRHREFVRNVLNQEVHLRAQGTRLITKDQETKSSPSVQYRTHMHSKGSPSDSVAAGYRWKPGTEIAAANPLTGETGEKQEVA
jgi:hypothetical protein